MYVHEIDSFGVCYKLSFAFKSYLTGRTPQLSDAVFERALLTITRELEICSRHQHQTKHLQPKNVTKLT